LYVLCRQPRSYTYAQLADLVAGVAARLRMLGVGPGDTVAVLVNSDERLVALMLAVASLGAVSVPVSVDSPPCRDVLQRFHRLRPFKAIALTGRFCRLVDDTIDRPFPVILDLDATVEAVSLAERAAWEKSIIDRASGRPFYINHTSGSSSNPKMIEATDVQLLANAESCLIRFGGGRDMRLMCTFVYHPHELFVRPLVCGGCAVLLPVHQGESNLATECLAGRVTHLMTNPHRAETLAALSDAELARLRAMKPTIEVGGGLLRDEVFRRLADDAGVSVVGAYGSTETSGVALASDADASRDGGLRPLAGYMACIVDEHGVSVPVGQVGELVISGPALAAGYLVLPPGEVRLSEGRFFTKDLALQHADGTFTVLGRIDNAVKLLGSREPLEPLEQALLTGFGPVAVAIQCLDIEPDDYFRRRLGTALLALVQLDGEPSGLSRATLRRLCRRALRRARLAAYLTTPSYFVFVGRDELLQQGGKLIRRHARSRFRFTFADWRPVDRDRLFPAPLLAGDIWRTVRRLGRESKAFRHPARQLIRELSLLVMRIVRRPAREALAVDSIDTVQQEFSSGPYVATTLEEHA
jgi:acyl-coenzyme A synthetase/AMP-(fatty) acid ligase